MSLLILVMTLTYLAMKSGVEHYLTLRSSIELQQDALTILARLSREGAESNPGSIWPTPVANSPLLPPGGEPVGVVFASPRNDAGGIEIDPVTKRALWQKRICYWYDPATKRLFRCVDPIVPPTVIPPAQDPTKTTAWFRDNTASDPLQGTVDTFEISTNVAADNLIFDLEVSDNNKGLIHRLQFLTSTTPKG